MASTSGRTRPALEVVSMFEPSRLEHECLSQAYASLVPILRRNLRLAPPQAQLPTRQAPRAERKTR
jgi:hypothetical protein